MKIERLDHVQLAMPAGQEDTARAFYSGVLGIPEVPKPPHLAVRGGAWFEGSGVKVHLGVDTDFRPARKAHPAFVVSGLREILTACRRDGYDVREDEPLPGYDRAYVYDPFGNRIEFLEPDGM